MIDIKNYLQDGACWQAQAILAYLRGVINFDRFGFNELLLEYRANVTVNQYNTSREHGYIFELRYDLNFVKHYAVFEHSVADKICVACDTVNTSVPTRQKPTSDSEPYDEYYEANAVFDSDEIEKASKWILSDMYKALDEYIDAKNIDIRSKENLTSKYASHK